jgi:molecular chaperone GrpE
MSKHFSHHEAPQHESLKDHEPGKAADPGAEAQGTAESAADTGDPKGTAGTSGAGEAKAAEQDAGGDPGEDAGSMGAGEAGPEDRVAGLEAQIAEAKDQFLRKAAEFENFRKRLNREKQDAIDFANQSLLLDLIPILDDFDRALQSAESSRDFNALYEGVGMIAKRLSSTLDGKWGLKSYSSAGMAFDPNFHEALMMEKSSAVPEQTVQMDLLRGYTLKDRVIRSAKVKVLVPDPSAPAVAAPAAAEEDGESGAAPAAP